MGAGNRSGFRQCIAWLAEKNPEWIKANMHWIPQVGRWDDLKALVGTKCETEALQFWVRSIMEGNGLAAKWTPREKNDKELYGKLRRVAGMTPKDFRKLIVKATNVVETTMCSQDWQDIDYNKVPSVAMARYNNAFRKHDPARLDQWKNALEKGVDENGNEVKVNAEVLFPHDVLRTMRADLSDSEGGYYGWTSYNRSANISYKDSKLANAQFAALPDFMEGTGQRVISICDFSGSMEAPVSGSKNVNRLDVSMSLGLYCSDRLGKDNPFYRKFIPFSNDSRLVDWRDETFSVAAQKYNDGWVGSTNIRAALDQILDAGRLLGATDDQMPTTLLIISDMQLDQGARDDMTSVEAGLLEWDKAGFKRPKIVYWNVAGYRNSPATSTHKDVGFVSGFSPSLLKAVLGGEDFTPMAILDKAIEKYEVVVPD